MNTWYMFDNRMKFQFIIGTILIGLIGCHNRLNSRNDSYDTNPVYPSYQESEPYAILAGQHIWQDGSTSNLYLIHWSGNALNNQSLLESIVDSYHIRKVNNI